MLLGWDMPHNRFAPGTLWRDFDFPGNSVPPENSRSKLPPKEAQKAPTAVKSPTAAATGSRHEDGGPLKFFTLVPAMELRRALKS